MTPVMRQSAPSLRDLFLSVLSGLLLTASFPPGKFSFLAWIALIPLFISVNGKAPRDAFKLGFTAGFFHFVTLLYWVIVVLGKYGNLHVAICLVALLLLSLYLALYPAVFSCLVPDMIKTPFASIFMATIWVSLEYLRAHIVTGFPWCLMGYSQYEHLALIQIANVTGVYGISFLIVLGNGLIFQTFFAKTLPRRPFLKWEWVIALVFMGATMVYGFHQLSKDQAIAKKSPSINAAVVQANIDQSVKWKPSYQEKTLLTYFRLSQGAAPFKPGLIVWPETALPFFYQNAPVFSSQMHQFADKMGAALLFGSPAFDRIGRHINYYNRAYMITPGIPSTRHYDKRHLVPFGEYVPLQKYLPFIRQLVEAAGNFASGDHQGPLKEKDLSLGVLICFEAIFPELARDLANGGAEILANITNDAWFGATSAPFQHLSMAVFRSVETGLPMIRAANTGISAFIGSDGDILSRSPLFEEALLHESIPFSPTAPKTVYTRTGDLFAIGMVVISLLKFLTTFFGRYGKSKRG